jgi:hypothetical protein
MCVNLARPAMRVLDDEGWTGHDVPAPTIVTPPSISSLPYELPPLASLSVLLRHPSHTVGIQPNSCILSDLSCPHQPLADLQRDVLADLGNAHAYYASNTTAENLIIVRTITEVARTLHHTACEPDTLAERVLEYHLVIAMAVLILLHVTATCFQGPDTIFVFPPPIPMGYAAPAHVHVLSRGSQRTRLARARLQ